MSAFYRLDIKKLSRIGALIPDVSGSFHWYDDEVDVCQFYQFERKRNSLVLTNNVGVSYRITLELQRCHFGGERAYFLCPNASCQRRVEHLYYRGTRFECRHCLNAAYPCQNETVSDRAHRRANKIRVRLGGECGISKPFPDKPKGMHWRTYENLRRKANEASEFAFTDFIDRFGSSKYQ